MPRECRCSCLTLMIRLWAKLNGGEGIHLRTWKPGAWKVALFRVCSAAHGCTISWVPAPRISGNRKKEPGCKAHHPEYSHASSILRTPHPDWGSDFSLGFLWLWLRRCHHLNHRSSLLSWSDGRLHVVAATLWDSLPRAGLGSPRALRSGDISAIVSTQNWWGDAREFWIAQIIRLKLSESCEEIA